MNLKKTYDRLAEDWHKEHQQDDRWIESTNRFISFLKPGALVLDVGCGGGTKTKYLTDKGLQVVGIDFSEKMIEIAKRETPDSTFLVLDLNDIETLDYEFDGIFIQAVLLHVPKKEVADKLNKMISILKKGGYLYIVVKEKLKESPEEEVKIENDYGYRYERFFSYFSKDEVESIMRNLGLKIVDSNVNTSGKASWIQVTGKKLS